MGRTGPVTEGATGVRRASAGALHSAGDNARFADPDRAAARTPMQVHEVEREAALRGGTPPGCGESVSKR